MYNKHNIAVAKVASGSRIKPALACVAFYGDRTVATDSFRLIEISATGKKQKVPTLVYASDLKVLKLKKDEEIGHKKVAALGAALGSELKGEDYPDIDQILDRGNDDEYVEVRLNAGYLAEICTILKGIDPFNTITLKVPTGKPYRPIVIEAESKPKEYQIKQKARALLMPTR
jgi:hypothetical protein